ncbi:MAG: hypothetical protein RL653_659 [Pseudomonadota bacterium]|jgi:hypothetical protein
MHSVLVAALSVLVTSSWTEQDVLTLNFARPEACDRLRGAMPEGNPDIRLEAQDGRCALYLPGVSAWAARPAEFPQLLQLAGLNPEQQLDLERLVDRVVRQGRVPALHLYPNSTPALVRVQEAVDEFTRGLASNSACACAQATLEQSRSWVGWTIRPTGNCGNGLLAGDAPAWCPESGRFVPMTLGVASVLLVVLGLLVRRALKRRAASAAEGASGSASP